MLQYTIAMMGYGPENTHPVVELTYNYGVTEYTKGNAYGQVNTVSLWWKGELLSAIQSCLKHESLIACFFSCLQFTRFFIV